MSGPGRPSCASVTYANKSRSLDIDIGMRLNARKQARVVLSCIDDVVSSRNPFKVHPNRSYYGRHNFGSDRLSRGGFGACVLPLTRIQRFESALHDT
jgi:hypothetical protein